jgi:hypothetical protein
VHAGYAKAASTASTASAASASSRRVTSKPVPRPFVHHVGVVTPGLTRHTLP